MMNRYSSLFWIFKEQPQRRSVPVEGPLEQELAGGFGEAGAPLVRLQDLRNHVVQPGGPLVQGALLLQGHLEVLLQTLDHALVTLADPRRLLLLDKPRVGQRGAAAAAEPPGGGAYLYVGEVHPVEVREHLVDLGGVLQNGAGRLGQVVQTGVTPQSLGERTDHRHLTRKTRSDSPD